MDPRLICVMDRQTRGKQESEIERLFVISCEACLWRLGGKLATCELEIFNL